MHTELFKGGFHAFSQAAGITVPVDNIYGASSHHIIATCFRSLASAVHPPFETVARTKPTIPSTHGYISFY